MSAEKSIIAWNVNCRRSPLRQYSHLVNLEEDLRANGSALVLACLSEVTAPLTSNGKTGYKTLYEVLQRAGYAVTTKPTSIFRRTNTYEGLGFASRDEELAGPIGEAAFSDTYAHIAPWFKPANWRERHRHHQRRIAEVNLGDIAIYSTHASFHSPPPTERSAILGHVGQMTDEDKKILIGDFNTGINNNFVREAIGRGWHKLRAPSGKRATWYGFELDHAFVSPALRQKTWLEIGKRGPSDHAPLILHIED